LPRAERIRGLRQVAWTSMVAPERVRILEQRPARNDFRVAQIRQPETQLRIARNGRIERALVSPEMRGARAALGRALIVPPLRIAAAAQRAPAARAANPPPGPVEIRPAP